MGRRGANWDCGHGRNKLGSDSEILQKYGCIYALIAVKELGCLKRTRIVVIDDFRDLMPCTKCLRRVSPKEATLANRLALLGGKQGEPERAKKRNTDCHGFV